MEGSMEIKMGVKMWRPTADPGFKLPPPITKKSINGEVDGKEDIKL